MKLYIIHGWTYSLDKWTEFCKLLRSRGFEPVQLRVPGLTSESSKVWDMNNYVTWLDGELKNEPHPVVLGHSNGGRIALAYAQKYPDKLKKLVLIGSAGIDHDQLATRLKHKVLWILAKVGKIFDFIPGLKRVFYKIIGARDYFEAPLNMKKTMQNMLRANKELVFDRMSVPTTIIWGSDDTYTPLSDGEQMARALPNAKLIIVDGARHIPFYSHPQEVADIIEKSLKD